MELISKEDAVALIKAEMDKIRTHSLVDGTARINLRLAKNIIEDMPTIDIVRCKECKKANTEDCSHSYWDDDWGEWRVGYIGDDWYCADGEREGE